MIIAVSLGGALSFEVAEEGIMERKPRASNQPLVGKHILLRTFWITTINVIAIIGIFHWVITLGHPIGQARAAAFTLLVTSSVFYGLNCRSNSEFALGKSLLRPSKPFWISCIVVMGLQALIVQVQHINRFFSCETGESFEDRHPIGGPEWGVIFAVSIAIFVLVRAVVERSCLTHVTCVPHWRAGRAGEGRLRAPCGTRC